MFDVAMYSFNGAEICELVSLFILNRLSAMFGADNVGLCRDDGLTLLPGTGGLLAEQSRKQLHGIVDQFNLKITIEASDRTVNYLDVTFELANDSYRPYRKQNSKPLYINRWAIRTEHALTLARKRPRITGQIQYGGARKECFCKVICHKTTF